MKEGKILFSRKNIWERIYLIDRFIGPERAVNGNEIILSELTLQEKKIYTWIVLAQKWINKLEKKVAQNLAQGPTKKMERRIRMIMTLQKEMYYLGEKLHQLIGNRLDPGGGVYHMIPFLLRAGFKIAVPRQNFLQRQQ